MKLLRPTLAALAAVTLVACNDAPPTAPDVPLEPTTSFARGGHPAGNAAGHADLLTDLPVEGSYAFDGGTAGDLAGSLTVTELSTDGAGGLLVDGVLTVTDGFGQTVTLPLDDVPATLSRTSGMLVAAQAQGPDEPGVCDILFLDLGPIFLDVLGLTVDLSEVVLDIDAVRGQNRLLGNLLCAVTGLLDPLGALQGILDRINQILGQASDLLDGISTLIETVAGDILGTISLDGLSQNEAGDLVATGTFSGLMGDGSVVNQAFETTASLGSTDPSSLVATALAPGGGRGNDETGACDILYLDLGPIFLDLLGLTVDLSPIELDVDAASGSGKLLGNLLCAVTGLLDSGGPVDGLLARISDLLGGLLG